MFAVNLSLQNRFSQRVESVPTVRATLRWCKSAAAGIPSGLSISTTTARAVSANKTFSRAQKLWLCLLAAGSLLAAQNCGAVTGGSLTFKFYDAAGNALSFAQVQALQTGPMAGAYPADAFLDPATLRLVSGTPMTGAGGFTFALPAQPVSFAINWPTQAKGYGLVILDNGGAGFTNAATVNFTYQAAKDIRRRLDAALAARPDYSRSTNFNAAYSAASNCIAIADASALDSVRGAQGQLALEQLVCAYDLLLKEYGPIYARAHKSATAPWLGVTLEDVTNYKTDLDKLAAMAGNFAWARIVFQPGDAPSVYTAAVSYAKSKGVKVMGLCVDSSSDTTYTRAQYLQRYKDFIAAFPNIDAWEVGNEVNGGWLSADIAGRVADVAAYCKTQNKKTYLTLFWQLNTSDTTFALFNWINANLPATVRSNLDYVGLSQYQEQAPLGVAFDQLMRRMQSEFPSQQIGMGELGYWITGQQYWWIGNTNVTAAKDCILDQNYRAALGYAGANGGCFWWNFASGAPDYDFDATMTNAITTLKNSLLLPPAAAITIKPAPGVVNISWPNTTPAWLLDRAPLGSNPPQWTQVPTNQYQPTATNVFFSANPAGGSFIFRLRQP